MLSYQSRLNLIRREMVIVRNECARLILPTSEKKKEKFKIIFYSFWNRNKVENMVLGLKAHIDNCYRDFSVCTAT